MADSENKPKNTFIPTEDLVKIFDAVANKFDWLEAKINDFSKFYNAFPESDGNGYAVRDRQPVLIALKNEEVLTIDAEDAYAVAMASLRAGRIVGLEERSPEFVAEVKALLGEEYAELEANTPKAVALASAVDAKEQKALMLEQAKQAYHMRKQKRAERKALLAQRAKASEAKDVEPDNAENV